MKAARACAILALLAAGAGAREPAGWNRAATPHFEIFSDGDPATLRSLALNLERLHAFILRQVGISPRAHREIRVISFASAQEYSQYRSKPGADAFFIGTEGRDYIVMPAGPHGDLRVAAHEYAHVLIHSVGWTLPEWIAEGIGDVVSTVQLRDRETRIGGDLPGRSQALKNGWMTSPTFRVQPRVVRRRPGGHLLCAKLGARRSAHAFALYRPAFPTLLAALASGVPAERALDTVYHTPLSAVERDLRSRIARGSIALPLPAVDGQSAQVRIENLTPFAARVMLADLRLANGDLPGAESAFRELAVERPASGEVLAATGTIALKRGDTGRAVAAWKRAVELGIADADLCYATPCWPASAACPREWRWNGPSRCAPISTTRASTSRCSKRTRDTPKRR
jgi:hypothetical protein